MDNESEEIEFLDVSKDYRKIVKNFKVDSEGNLWCKVWGNISADYARWDLLITRDRLDEDDWISLMAGKRTVDLEEFIYAYLNACRIAGIKELKIVTRGFDCRYSEEVFDETLT